MSKLKLKIFSAKDLVKSDVVSTGDFYVKIIFQGVEQVTQEKKDTLTPEWNEEFEFDVIPEKDKTILLNVLDKDIVNINDSQGKATLQASEYKNNKQRLWVALSNGEAKNGQLDVEVELCSLLNKEDSMKRPKSTQQRPASADSLRQRTKTLHSESPSKATDKAGTLRFWACSKEPEGLENQRQGPGRNFVNTVDDSFNYIASKYSRSPGPSYNPQSASEAVRPHQFNATFGTLDRDKFLVEKTLGPGPSLNPKRDFSTFQRRPIITTIGRSRPREWWKGEGNGPTGFPLNPNSSTSSRIPHSPNYVIPKDSREKHLRYETIGLGPAGYARKELSRPTSLRGTFGKQERNSTLWIFKK